MKADDADADRGESTDTTAAFGKINDLDTKGAAERLGMELVQVDAQLKNLVYLSSAHGADGHTHKGYAHDSVAEDNDEGHALRQRLLHYRYERRLKSPAPPLDRNLAPLPRDPTDKIDRNRDVARLHWIRTRH